MPLLFLLISSVLASVTPDPVLRSSLSPIVISRDTAFTVFDWLEKFALETAQAEGVSDIIKVDREASMDSASSISRDSLISDLEQHQRLAEYVFSLTCFPSVWCDVIQDAYNWVLSGYPRIQDPRLYVVAVQMTYRLFAAQEAAKQVEEMVIWPPIGSCTTGIIPKSTWALSTSKSTRTRIEKTKEPRTTSSRDSVTLTWNTTPFSTPTADNGNKNATPDVAAIEESVTAVDSTLDEAAELLPELEQEIADLKAQIEESKALLASQTTSQAGIPVTLTQFYTPSTLSAFVLAKRQEVDVFAATSALISNLQGLVSKIVITSAEIQSVVDRFTLLIQQLQAQLAVPDDKAQKKADKDKTKADKENAKADKKTNKEKEKEEKKKEKGLVVVVVRQVDVI